jgi:hypothetical protein
MQGDEARFAIIAFEPLKQFRSQYSLGLYGWAKKYVEGGAQTISLEELRSVFGLESITGYL